MKWFGGLFRRVGFIAISILLLGFFDDQTQRRTPSRDSTRCATVSDLPVIGRSDRTNRGFGPLVAGCNTSTRSL